MLSWPLEDWLTESGDLVLRKQVHDASSLTPREALIYEIWLLDTEARNGGLSQYFHNRGLEQWHSCVAAARVARLHTFFPFERTVGELIAGHADPYEALVRRGESAENLWYSFQEPVVAQLKQLCGAP
jgi:hypothetical protein